MAGVVRSFVPAASRAAADELLVSFHAKRAASIRERIRSEPGVTVLGALIDLPVELVRVDPADRDSLAARLREVQGVESVQPNMVEKADQLACPTTSACTIPDDPGFLYQWYLYNASGTVQPPGSAAPIFGADVGATLAWEQTLGSVSTRVAIIDTGIDATQPDLAGKVVTAANFTASDSTSDLSGHGTHVAGIVAAGFDNATGIAGMAPSAQLMDVKVLAVDANGTTAGDCADVADGIVWAVNHAANVLNLSLGSPSPCQAMALAIDYASSHGALVVAAAGNEGTTRPFYPAAYENVISVGASDTRDEPASFSNRGASWVDVTAPGVGIVSTLPTYANATGALDYGYMSGTSMAAPIVSGIAALIWSQMPAGNTAREVRERLFTTSQSVAGTASDWRYGRVDACLAVSMDTEACSSRPPAVAPTTTSPTTPTNEPPTTPTSEPTTPPSTEPPTTLDPEPTLPAPGELAQPAPIQTPPAKKAPPPFPVVDTAPGSYRGSLAHGGRLRLTVADGGKAVVGFHLTARLHCRVGLHRRIRVTGLSTSDYSPISATGEFQLRLRRSSTALRGQRIRLTGRIVSAAWMSGTLRITGHVTRPVGRCESHTIKWSAHIKDRPLTRRG